ncbi:MAG: hypothetical protein VB858_03170 [Planctomycetaceae bacterium]
MKRITLCASLILLVSVSSTHAQVLLKQVPRENSHVETRIQSNVKQTLNIGGMDVVTAADTQMVMSVTTRQRDAEGRVPADSKVKSMQVTTEVQGQVYNFDSANPDEKGTSPLEFLRDLHKLAVEQTTTTVYGKDDRVVEVKIDKSVGDKLPEQAKGLVGDLFDSDQLKFKSNQELDRLPGQVVKTGDSWTRMEVWAFGSGQTMTFEVQYTYAGTAEHKKQSVDRITARTLSAVFKIDDQSPLPLRVKSSELKAVGTTELLFDRTHKTVVATESTVQVTGDLTFTVNGQELPAKLDLKMTGTSETAPVKVQ